MKKRIIRGLVAAASVIAATPTLAAPHHALKGAEFASMARISLATARATALKARPGKVTDQELEKEAGGSGLRYSFDIKSSGKIYEVGVDAKTGAVLENDAEGAHPD